MKRLILILYFFLPVEYAAAQHPFSKAIVIEEENLTIKATVLIRDHLGFIWIGTSMGIFKYNSTVPENITANEKDKPYITALFEDTEGTIWAGCKSGRILKISNHRISYFTPGKDLPKVAITSILQDAKKRIWLATAGEGIFCYDDTLLHTINSKDGLSDDYVNCLYSQDGGEIIAGTDRGLSFIILEAGKITISIFTSKNGLSDNLVRCVTRSGKKDAVWVGTQSRGSMLFSVDSKQIVESAINKNNWEYGQVNDIIELNDIVYLATEQNGVISYDGKTKEINPGFLDTLFPKRIADLQPDNEGNIWAAAENKLLGFTGDYLKFWYTSNGVNLIKIHSILADDENKLWFTPDLRLYESPQVNFGKDGLQSFDITPPQEHIDITGLYKDRLGFLWIGTMGEGLFRMNIATGNWRRIAENPIAYFGNILSVTGKNNQVWISTLNGVSRFTLTESNYELNSKIQFSNYNKKDGLGSDYIYHILIDKKDRVWFATDGAGVAVFENNTFTNFHLTGQFPSNVAYSLAEDNKQHIWISTYNEGLFEYDGSKFIQYGIKSGLTDLAITSIAVDNYNNVIAVNKKGVDILDPLKKIVQHYGPESGFSELQPNLNSITKGLDGRIWIGTDNGIVILNTFPSLSAFMPVAVFEHINLFNKPIDTAATKTFTYDQNNFSFKLAAAYYKAPEKIKFQYWLEGYSKNWDVTGDRVINFPQLHPGKYLMKIRASANENFDAAPIAFYRFTVSKSFWTTWWFYLLTVLIIAALLYWFIKRRIKYIRKAEHSEREKFQLQYDALKNQVNPHFLFNSFNALMNIVEDDPAEASELIGHLSRFYRKMTAYSKKELISLDEELELLNSYLFIQKKRFGPALMVSIDIEPAIKESTLIPPLVLQLLAENAVKHNAVSKEKPLHISIVTEQDMIVVRNNISIKLDKEESEGVGLLNIKNRYKLLTNREIIQEQTHEEFIIRLPVLQKK